MKVLQSVMLAIAACGLLGCKSTFHIQGYSPPANKIRSEDAVFIIVPADAYDEPGSGRKCADTLLKAFRPYASRLKKSDTVSPLQAHLKNAATHGFTYVLNSDILSWEEEPTEWSGKPDFLNIQLQLLHMPEGKVVAETRFQGRSKWATFGGDHVEDLLKPMADGWARAIYQGDDFKAPDDATKR